jgi:uncharacterized protein (TIGR03083 family)
MTALDYLAHLAADSDRFADILAETDPARQVPSCPDWTAVDLLWHLTEVQTFWGTIARNRLSVPEPAEAAKPERPTDVDALMHLFTTASETLRTALRETPPETQVWTWAPDKTIGFIRRRQAHEALIHRVDAELTAGLRSDLDELLASDGVDEVLRIMHGGIPEWGSFDRDDAGAMVETTDTGRRWLLGFGHFTGTHPPSGTFYDEDLFDVFAQVGSVDAVVRGTAADLDLWLWGRSNADRIERTGDEEVLRRLQAVIDQGID